MKISEKIGLLFFISGIVQITAIFILGSGNVSDVLYNGEPISTILPIILFVGGCILFLFTGE